MADFDKALAHTLRFEGGWSDHPSDPGGATNHGITLATARKFGIMDKEALRNIDMARVRAIYRHGGYWLFGGVADQRVATKLFDMAVNMGPGAAVRLLRGCLRAAGANVDNLKDAMDSAINAAEPGALLEALCGACEAHYRAIVRKKPSQSVFLKGWLRRAWAVPDA